MYHLRDENERASGYNPDQTDFPHKTHPSVIRNVGHAQISHQSCGHRKNVVTEAVAEVKRQDGGLSGDAYHVRYRSENRHNYGRLSGTGGYKGVDYKVHPVHAHAAQVGREYSQNERTSVYDGVQDVGCGEHAGGSAGQAQN